MATDGDCFDQWIDGAAIPRRLRSIEHLAVLKAAFAFLQNAGDDYASKRIVAHFLLHCQLGWKLAQIARLVGVTRPTASRHNQLSSREVVREIQHRLSGRPYGKLLPRYAGPIAQFLLTHKQASREEVLDFIDRTWNVQVSFTALHNFLKKYGLDRPSLDQTASPHVSEDAEAVIEVLENPPVSGLPILRPPEDFFFARTQYAGAFLLMPQVLEWWRIAQDCLSDDYGLQRGFLTSIFMLVCGIERVFHLEEMTDRGFAVLTGSQVGSPPTRHQVGAWRSHLLWNEVDSFCHRTSPWGLLQGQHALLSLDEHAIPRWTKKFSIRKGYVTTRNKYMRSEKLFYGYEVRQRRFVTVKATPGNVELRDVSGLLTRRTLRYGQPASLHALFDAGAGKSDADVRSLFTLANEIENLEVTLRACRYPHRMRLWKALPAEAFTAYEEPGACEGAPPREVRLAETATVLKGESEEDAVRTIVCRQVIPGPKKDRWHPIYTTQDTDDSPPREVLEDFRQRQHHEQAYRVTVHDTFLNAARCGYDKESPDRRRPRFHRGPLQMIGWLTALLYNACGDLATEMGSAWEDCFIRTLRNALFRKNGTVYCTPTSVIVYFDDELNYPGDVLPLIDRINREQHRIPWMDNRLLVLSVCPDGRNRAGP